MNVFVQALDVQADLLQGVDGLLAVIDREARLVERFRNPHQLIERLTCGFRILQPVTDSQSLVIHWQGLLAVAQSFIRAAQIVQGFRFTAGVAILAAQLQSLLERRQRFPSLLWIAGGQIDLTHPIERIRLFAPVAELLLENESAEEGPHRFLRLPETVVGVTQLVIQNALFFQIIKSETAGELALKPRHRSSIVVLGFRLVAQ